MLAAYGLRAMGSEERFWLVLESSFDPAFVVDADGTCRYANPASVSFLGPDCVPGRNMNSFVHPDDHAGWPATDHASRNVRLRHADGSWHRMEVVTKDLRHDPEVAGFLVLARDAEPNPAAAMRLEVLRGIDRAILVEDSTMMTSVLDGLRRLTSSVHAVALLWDTDAGVARVVAGRIEGEDDAFPLSDFSPVSTFLEMPTIHVPDLADVATPSRIIERARDAGMRSLLTQAMISHGEFFGVLTLLSPERNAYDAENVAVARDVANQVAIALLQVRLQERLETHARQLEERVLERTAQLEVANQELEMFNRSVSHDLRSPLQVIGGFCGLLREELAGSASATVIECLDHIRDGVRSMDAIINALLRLARVARAKIRWDNVNLSLLAEMAADSQRSGNPDRIVEFRATPDLVARGDRELLSIVLVNLLANAWKYTRRRSVARIEFGVAERNGATEYFVRDNGAGFEMDHAHTLFAPFERLHRKEEFEGTGLGLATVRQILRRHGGDIRAEGATDKGATFYFSLGDEPTS